MTEKEIVEACISAWLRNKRLAGQNVTLHDEALVERLHRELGTPHFRKVIAANRRLMDLEFGHV